MTLYIGDKPVGLMKVVKDTKYIEKTKFGVSIDDLLGNVDENGSYSKRSAPVSLNLSGVKSTANFAFAYLFAYYFSKELTITANDLVSVGERAFYYAAYTAGKIDKFVATFDSLTEIKNSYAFSYFGPAGADEYSVVFLSLEYIKGTAVFDHAFSGTFVNSGQIDLGTVFPKLRHVEGSTVFGTAVPSSSTKRIIVRLNLVETIIGPTSQYSAAFYNLYGDFYFPKCTQAENYIFYPGNKCVVHFAAANQAAIEACPGYDKMFGASEIYFDL